MEANKANRADETQGEVQISFFLTRDTILTPIGKMHDGMRISVAVPILPCLNLEAVDEIPNHGKLLHPPRSNTTTTEWGSWMEYGCQKQKDGIQRKTLNRLSQEKKKQKKKQQQAFSNHKAGRAHCPMGQTSSCFYHVLEM